MELYDTKAVEKLLTDERWESTLLNEGVLLGGDYILEREGYQTMVVYEVYLNEWSSAYTVKKFKLNKPKSQKMFENLVEKLTDL